MNTTQSLKHFFNRHLLDIVPLVLIAMVGMLFFIDVSLKYATVAQAPLPIVLPGFTLSEYPFLSQAFSPILTAESAILVDDGSKVILYVYNIVHKD